MNYTIYIRYVQVAGERLKRFRERAVDGRRNEGKTVGEPPAREKEGGATVRGKERTTSLRGQLAPTFLPYLVTTANQSASSCRLYSNPAFRPRIVYEQPINGPSL